MICGTEAVKNLKKSWIDSRASRRQELQSEFSVSTFNNKKGFNDAKAQTRQSGSLGHGAGLHEHGFFCDPPKASACGSAKRPSRNRRRKHADYSALEMPLVTSALFCGTEPARL
jgi:hypothetical protein